MKIVREHINEKFSEKSDPVKDMKIGINFPDNFKPMYILIREYPGIRYHKGTVFGFVGPGYLRAFNVVKHIVDLDQLWHNDYFTPWIGEYFEKI